MYTRTPQRPGTWETNWWQRVLLGIVLILASLFALQNAVEATVLKAALVGAALMVAGIFEVGHALWVDDQSGFLWRLLIGALYGLGGALLFANPLAASVIVTLTLAATLIGAGLVRVVLAVQSPQPSRWLLFTSGVVGILGGGILLVKWPFSGLWVFGLVVGIDLLLHGTWWIVAGWVVRER